MKKIYLVLSFFMALTLIAAPSFAAMGIDDPVPGTDFIVPFIVQIGGSGLDTIVQIQEVSDAAGFGGTPATAAGSIHWFLYSRASVEVADDTQAYSGGDVVPLSIRVLLTDYLTAAELASIAVDLDGDGTVDHYVGYMYGQSLSTAIATDNLYVTFLYADLAAGRASGSYAAMKEFSGTLPLSSFGAQAANFSNATGYIYEQVATAKSNNATAADSFPDIAATAALNNSTAQTVEAFTPASYFWTVMRSVNPGAVAVTANRTDNAIAALNANLNYISFTPRWYLHNAAAETYFIIWKNRNHSATGENNTITVLCWDEVEGRASKSISLPNELNIIRVRDFLPPSYYTTYPAGGWVDIRIADAAATFTSGYLENWRYTEFLFYTWTYAADATAGLNWAALWNDRKVGTLGVAPVG